MHVIPVILLPEIFAHSHPEIFAYGPQIAVGLKPAVGGPDIGVSNAKFFSGDHPG